MSMSDEGKIITFTLDGRAFGIDMAALVEIREWEEPTPLPKVAPWIKGVTNLRGTVIPVFGLAERLGWRPSPIHARSCILVVSIGAQQAGLLIDEVADIVAIDRAAIQPAPELEISEPGVIAGLVQVATRAGEGAAETMVTLLDLDALHLTGAIDEAA